MTKSGNYKHTQDARIRAEYPDTMDISGLALSMGWNVEQLHKRAQRLGIQRSKEVVAGMKADAIRNGLFDKKASTADIVGKAMANRLDLEVAWHQVVRM